MCVRKREKKIEKESEAKQGRAREGVRVCAREREYVMVCMREREYVGVHGCAWARVCG